MTTQDEGARASVQTEAERLKAVLRDLTAGLSSGDPARGATTAGAGDEQPGPQGRVPGRSEPDDGARSGHAPGQGPDAAREHGAATERGAAAEHDGRPVDDCPVCRANRLAHTLTARVGPDLVEELGRALGAAGRTMQVLAEGWRRHTDEQHHTVHEHEHDHHHEERA